MFEDLMEEADQIARVRLHHMTEEDKRLALLCEEFVGDRDQAMTPLSQQIAELWGELDNCLSDLDTWRNEGGRCPEAVIAELAQYGLAFEEALLDNQESPSITPRHLLMDDDVQVQDLDEDLDGSRFLGSPKGVAKARGAAANPSAAEERRRQAEMMLAEDEVRLARLRKEVEELRAREGLGYAASLTSNGLADGANDLSCNLADFGDSCLDSTMGLSAWCDEVDAALAGAESYGTAPAYSAEEEFEKLHADLEKAKRCVDKMESHFDAKAAELEDLLAECQTLQD